MANLAVYMNGYRVGTFTKTTSGAHQFQYHESWLALPGSRPISLSMPLRHQVYRGDEAYNFFDNLLPDNPEVRNRVVARYQAASTQPFDLLSCIGQDSVGALQLVTEGDDVPDVRRIDYRALSDDETGTDPDQLQIRNPFGYGQGARGVPDLYRRGARKDCAALSRWPLVLATQRNADNPHYQTPYRQD